MPYLHLLLQLEVAMLYSTGRCNRGSSYQELSFPNKKANSCILVKRFLTFHTIPFLIPPARNTQDDGAVAAILWPWNRSHKLVITEQRDGTRGADNIL